MEVQPATIAFEPNKKLARLLQIIANSSPKEIDLFHVQRRERRKSFTTLLSNEYDANIREPKSCPNFCHLTSNKKPHTSFDSSTTLTLEMENKVYPVDFGFALKSFMLTRSPVASRNITVTLSDVQQSVSIVTHFIFGSNLLLLVTDGSSTSCEFVEAFWIVIPNITKLLRLNSNASDVTFSPSLAQLGGIYTLPRRCPIKNSKTLGLESTFFLSDETLLYFDVNFETLILMNLVSTTLWIYKLGDHSNISYEGRFPFCRFMEISNGCHKKIKVTLWGWNGVVIRRDWILEYMSSESTTKPMLKNIIVEEPPRDPTTFTSDIVECIQDDTPCSLTWVVVDLIQVGSKIYYALSHRGLFRVICVDINNNTHTSSVAKPYSGKMDLKLWPSRHGKAIIRIDRNHLSIVKY